MAPIKPTLEFVFRIRMELGIRQKFGPTPRGFIRGFVSAAGGTIDGPRLNGRVVRKQRRRLGDLPPDNAVEFDARYMLEADDGTPIYMLNRGYPPCTAGNGCEDGSARAGRSFHVLHARLAIVRNADRQARLADAHDHRRFGGTSRRPFHLRLLRGALSVTRAADRTSPACPQDLRCPRCGPSKPATASGASGCLACRRQSRNLRADACSLIGLFGWPSGSAISHSSLRPSLSRSAIAPRVDCECVHDSSTACRVRSASRCNLESFIFAASKSSRRTVPDSSATASVNGMLNFASIAVLGRRLTASGSHRIAKKGLTFTSMDSMSPLEIECCRRSSIAASTWACVPLHEGQGLKDTFAPSNI